MRLTSLLLACVCIGSLVGCPNSQPNTSTSIPLSDENPVEDNDVNEKLSERVNRLAVKLTSDISKEIETVGQHDWAGSYYKGDGLGENVSLILSPKNGYLFEWHGCMGLYDLSLIHI